MDLYSIACDNLGINDDRDDRYDMMEDFVNDTQEFEDYLVEVISDEKFVDVVKAIFINSALDLNYYIDNESEILEDLNKEVLFRLDDLIYNYVEDLKKNE